MKRPKRLFTLAMFSAASAAACAAVLGIDDRKLDQPGDSGADGDAEAGSVDGSDDVTKDVGTPDVVIVGDGSCEPDACATAGGTCVPTIGCSIGCDAGGCGTIKCPPGQDCHITCNVASDCPNLKCIGGTSCTINCLGPTTCATNTTCESETCQINCLGDHVCRYGVVCDASVCNVKCIASNGTKDTCEEGVTAFGSKSCSIFCDGDDVCEKVVLSCNASPDASIVCGPTEDPCKTIAPSCDGGYCFLGCEAGAGCPKHCCNASVCNVSSRFGTKDCQ